MDISEQEYNAALKRSKKHQAGCYTERVKMKGKREIIYMSEMLPHYDFPVQLNENTWKVIFHAIEENYFFIYRFNGKLHKVKPEKGVIYEFEFKKYHALLHESRVNNFHKRNYWKTWKAENKIKCVFEFIDEIIE